MEFLSHDEICKDVNKEIKKYTKNSDAFVIPIIIFKNHRISVRTISCNIMHEMSNYITESLFKAFDDLEEKTKFSNSDFFDNMSEKMAGHA